MSIASSSLISLSDFSANKIYSLFEKAINFEEEFHQESKLVNRSAALLFFESSTRTRCSFELAVNNLGLRSILLSGTEGTSLDKGESIEDTIYNIASMGPDLLVVRCGDGVDLEKLSQQVQVPIVNAGWGQRGHPTQALLDALTLYREFGKLDGKRVLIVGDVKHSRVATSNFELLTKLGVEVAICAPSEFKPATSQQKSFEKLAEGLAWADAVMALRCQFERHESKVFSKQQYVDQYQLNAKTLVNFKGLVLHPGPINHGVELAFDTLKDPRSRIFKQVQNGVLVRMAVVADILGIGN